MRITLYGMAFALSVCTLPSVAGAQPDVGVFTTSDAEALLADGEAVPECEVRLEDGQCPQVSQTRGFSFARPKSSSSSVSTGSSSKTAYTKPSKKKQASQGRMTVKKSAPARVRPAAREVPLQFALGSYELSPQSMANLKNLASVLNKDEHKAKRIKITGHTDKSGSLAVNQRLSQQRADAAARYLETVGVASGRIDTEGRAFQDTLPGFSKYSPRNRRVEVQRID